MAAMSHLFEFKRNVHLQDFTKRGSIAKMQRIKRTKVITFTPYLQKIQFLHFQLP